MTPVWILALISAYIAGVMSIKTSLQVTFWRQLKRTRNAQSEIRRAAAAKGLWLSFGFVAWCLTTIALALLATFGGAK